MKDDRQVTEILEAFDLTKSYRAAGELAGCSPNTVADWVAKRDRGELGDTAAPARRDRLTDGFVDKIEEWVDRSDGKIRADVCYDKLVGLGFTGSDRTVRGRLLKRKRRCGHYGVTIARCVPADPESKGGSEAAVRVAKADLVPTAANLRGDYTSRAELAAACDAFMTKVDRQGS